MMGNHTSILATMLSADPEIVLETRQLLLLSVICEKEHLRLPEASEVVKVSLSQTSRLLNDLVRRGYVSRQSDAVDMRLILFVPTKKGIALDARVQAHLAAIRRPTKGEERVR